MGLTKSSMVQLSLSREDELRFEKQQREQGKKFEREVFGHYSEEGGRPDFRRPPGRPDLSYGELGSMETERREEEKNFWKRVKKPKSRVKVQSKAWALDLHESRSKLDSFARSLLQSYDFYLCRYVLQLVEAEGETIGSATIEILHPEAMVIYRLWPNETHKPKGSLKAKVEVGAKVGITKSLDIVDASAEGSANIVWETSWKWATAIVKAWGTASNIAGWELKRDSETPFAGDRELYLMIQMSKGADLAGVTASVQSSIKPAWLGLFLVYDSERTGPVPITHHVGRRIKK